ncbi:hypothetical protein [Thalassolituus sp. C2-1]|jgi:hypothetical protein|uniref:hypothetical protein n=1 Tax=Venatorbacter sp. C2-1 TaxID=2597518 RepID=UPI000C5B9804|nr:hypothetical protein [Thalassolituus sp. C2-1]MAY15396.1 hypothetical protein [Oceanospirillaceae bacterium]TVV43016.1 hypothetical protein FOT50_11245 [Thalassolituus sp. C2-1]
MKIIKILLLSTMFHTLCSYAAMKPMDEATLSETYGQAIFEVTDQQVSQADGSALSLLRLTMGARIEINANVEEISLGRYWRPEGTNCSGGPDNNKICYNNVVPVDYNDNIDWACTAKPCGSVGLDANSYKSSSLTHTTGGASFFEYPGGYQPDSGVDVKLRDVTMGQIRNENGVYEMLPFVQENPYFEFAFDESSGVRKLVGFRMGAEDAFGYQGNIIDVISGFIRPTITADTGFLGQVKLEAFLGGVRTIGWLDANNLTIFDVSGLASLLITDPQSLVNMSKEAQLFPVQSNYLEHTGAFFFSVGTRSIQWSSVGGFSPEVTEPGFWLNMGGDGGLIANTRAGDHPNNYFPGHPKYDLYSGSENYGNVNNLPKWSQTYRNH